MKEWLELLGVGLENLAHRGLWTTREAVTLGRRPEWWRLRAALWRESLRGPAFRVAAREGAGRGVDPEDLVYGETPPWTAWSILRELRAGEGDRVVDLGCGTGLVPIVARLFFGTPGLGVEILPGLLAKARRLAAALQLSDLEWREGDFRATALPPGTLYFLSPTALCESSWKQLQGVMEQAPVGARAVTLSVPLPGWEVLSMEKRPYSWGMARTYLQMRPG